jgi:hypothetical protein
MASFDLSAPFRQGLMVSVSHPRIFFRNFNAMFKSFGSEKTYHAIHDEILARPTWPLMHEAGLSITELGRLEKREEQFMSNYAERIPVAGHGVRASGRAYTAFLNKTRADVFDLLVSKAEQQGLDIEDEKLTKSIARFVNSATGRGDLGTFQSHAVTLNTLMFSPRLLWSRLNFMNPVYYARLDPFARKEALKAAVGLVGTIGTVLALMRAGGIRVSGDPRNADWAKIRLGNTRIDILGGFQQPPASSRSWHRHRQDHLVHDREDDDARPQGPGNSRSATSPSGSRDEAVPRAVTCERLLQGDRLRGQAVLVEEGGVQRMIPLLAQDIPTSTTRSGLAARGRRLRPRRVRCRHSDVRAEDRTRVRSAATRMTRCRPAPGQQVRHEQRWRRLAVRALIHQRGDSRHSHEEPSGLPPESSSVGCRWMTHTWCCMCV